ncbi:MAG: FAD-dependent oxidoreductase [Bacteriovoracaceae bacterium]
MRRFLYNPIVLTLLVVAAIFLIPQAAIASEEQYDYDLIIYGTSSSGIGALRLFTMLRGTEFGNANTKLAIISSSRNLETPLVNGLNTEDLFGGDLYANGLYKYFRENIISYYQSKGINPLTNGRLSFESSAANNLLWWYINYGSSYWDGTGRRNVSYFSAHLLGADPTSHAIDLMVEDEGERRITGRYMIDASPTLDLARMLGVSYRVGKDETIYNDILGNRPLEPTSENGWITALQLMAGLPTFSWSKNNGTPIDNRWWLYDSSLYSPERIADSVSLVGFKDSWSNKVSMIPYGKHELNEEWSDFQDPIASFRYVFYREERGEIRARLMQEQLDKIRYLQENGYPDLNLVQTYPSPYFRGELMIASGLDRLTVDRVGTPEEEAIAFGFYNRYDRHEIKAVSKATLSETFLAVPYRIIFNSEIDWILVTDGACLDYQAYNGPFRMEPVRMNVGGAVGATISLALKYDMRPAEVPYPELRRILDQYQWRYWLR